MPGLVVRRPSPDEVEAVAALVNAHSQALHGGVVGSGSLSCSTPARSSGREVSIEWGYSSGAPVVLSPSTPYERAGMRAARQQDTFERAF